VLDDQEGEQVEIYAGATNPPEAGAGYPFRYNWLEFALGGTWAAPMLRVTVHPRIWDYTHPRFTPDLMRLQGRESLTFEVACPNFRSTPEAPAPSPQPRTEPTEDAQRETEMVDQKTRDFDQLQYYFWAYLDWNQRLKALVQIDVLPSTRSQPLPQTLERMALDTAKNKGKLGELWDVVMQAVPSEKRVDNPYIAGSRRGQA